MGKDPVDKDPVSADRLLRAVMEVDAAMQNYRDLAVDVIGLSVRAPDYRGGEYLITVRGVDSEGARIVAFHSATSLMELLAGLAARLGNGSLTWKEDRYAR